jgi:hypothetical protein
MQLVLARCKSDDSKIIVTDAKPSNKLLAVTELDSDTWARSKKLKR